MKFPAHPVSPTTSSNMDADQGPQPGTLAHHPPVRPRRAGDSLSPLERAVRDIVGRTYDRDHGDPPERFTAGRALTITAIPSAYEYAAHVVIAISGTPCRGSVMVSLTYQAKGIDWHSQRRLKHEDVEVLRDFVAEVSGMAPDRIPCNFIWSNLDEDGKPVLNPRQSPPTDEEE